MKSTLGSLLYHLLLPIFFLLSLPAWIRKNLQRRGFGTGLRERFGLYQGELDFEPCHTIHLHAISVGESLLALKLIRAWRKTSPHQSFVLAVGTPTAHQLATQQNLPNLRITYAPLDFPYTVRSYLRRFQPRTILFIEGELWPNLLKICHKKNIPTHLLNARFSPRSRSRYLRFAPWIRPIFSKLTSVCLQDQTDQTIWTQLGLTPSQIILTGSLKLDPATPTPPQTRPEFTQILQQAFHPSRHQHPLILLASSHPQEETYIATALQHLPIRLAITPRHAERRHQLLQELTQLPLTPPLTPILRSQPIPPHPPLNTCLIIDSTGELPDWTAHADLILIGKSFLSHGGQNPSEAILAHKPIISGPNMENFEPLTSTLRQKNAILTAHTPQQLQQHIHHLLLSPNAHTHTTQQTNAATHILNQHLHATQRILQHLQQQHPSPRN